MSFRFVEKFQKMYCCTDNFSDVSNWLEVNNDGDYAALTDEEIIVSRSSKETENDCTDEIRTDDDNYTTTNDAEAATHLDQFVVYFKRQIITT